MGIFQSALSDHKIDHLFYFFALVVMILNDVDDASFLLPGAVIQGIDQRQGHFFLFNIDTRWFAYQFIRSKIKKIILYLECNSGKRSKVPEGLYHFFIGSHRHGSASTAG